MKYMDIKPMSRKDEFDFLMAQRKEQKKIPVVGANEPVLSLLSFENVLSVVHSLQAPHSYCVCEFPTNGGGTTDQLCGNCGKVI